MTSKFVSAVLVLTGIPLALAGCDSNMSSDEAAAATQTASVTEEISPVKLPPMVAASHTYRCKDNSLVYIDFLNDKVTVHLKTEKNGKAVALTASEPGKPYEADGYSLTRNGSMVQLSRPDRPGMSCKV